MAWMIAALLTATRASSLLDAPADDQVPYAALPAIPDMEPAAALAEAGKLLSSLLHQLRSEIESGEAAAAAERVSLFTELESVEDAKSRVQARVTALGQEQELFPAREQELLSDANVHTESIAQYRASLNFLTDHTAARIQEKQTRVSGLRGVDLALAQRHARLRSEEGSGELEDMLVSVRQGVFDTMVAVEEDIVNLHEALATNRTATGMLIADEDRLLNQANANLRALATHKGLLQGDLTQDSMLLSASSSTAELLARQVEAVNHTWRFEATAIEGKIAVLHDAVTAIPLPSTMIDTPASL